ncbi:MAG TPA: ABC transporter permease [Phycisphaeraceae bacterium]|nr:ABC transporter permease [Phycisphaeraceae bacterium]
MLGQLLAITRNTFLESIRQPIYIVLLLGQGILTIFLVSISAFSMSNDNKLFMDMCIGSVFGTGVVLAAFLATSVLSREIDNKTVLTVISKPIGRPVFVLGKYMGVAGAIAMAAFTMMIYFLLAYRHGVMSTARDKFDQPVLVFSFVAAFLSIGVAVWCNYFYNWVFNSTAALLLTPLITFAWFLTLIINKKWHVQPVTTDFHLELVYVLAAVMLAILVITAVALAASTRLGQVMTLVICLGVFFLGLLGNYVFGRRAVSNPTLAVVRMVEVEKDEDNDFSDDGDTWFVSCEPVLSLEPGSEIYYGPHASGLKLVTPRQTDDRKLVVLKRRKAPRGSFEMYVKYMDPKTGKMNYPEELKEKMKPAGLYLVNRGGLHLERPVRVGDYLFARPTKFNAAAFAAWTILPNLQSFWLVDAATQEIAIPPHHMLMVTLYALLCIVALLSLAVFLFQTREVG